MARRTIKVRIMGRVQGVGYRAWTERTATELALSGWVRNRRDGSVEAVFQGPTEAVGAMIGRCWSGPPGAKVAAVDVEEQGDATVAGFTVRPTE